MAVQQRGRIERIWEHDLRRSTGQAKFGGKLGLSKLAYATAYATLLSMNAYRHVKLFKNGRNQAVRIPREFELPGEDAIMRRDGDKLIIEPSPARSLLALLAELDPIEESFPEFDDRPPEPIDL
jgi:antitoxin VapB